MESKVSESNSEQPDEAARREAVWAAWEGRSVPEPRGWRRWLRRETWRDELAPGEEGDADGYVAPPRRSAFPPSFLILCSVGLAILALEPTVDLSYTLFGPSEVVKLGETGAYHLDAAKDGARASISGFTYSERGTFSHYLRDYEVFALTSVPVLVRRAPHPKPPANTAELYEGEGRLIRLDTDEASFFERLVRPAARYSTMRQQFEAIGQVPTGKPCWLLLDGEVPRAHLLPIVLPFVLWAAALFFASRAWRSYRVRQQRLLAHER